MGRAPAAREDVALAAEALGDGGGGSERWTMGICILNRSFGYLLSLRTLECHVSAMLGEAANQTIHSSLVDTALDTGSKKVLKVKPSGD